MDAHRSPNWTWKFTAIVVIVLLCVAQAMAASRDLHHHLHEDCEDHGNDCVVTLMLQGGYENVVPDIVPVTIISVAPDVPMLPPRKSDLPPGHLVGGVLAHAPPRGP